MAAGEYPRNPVRAYNVPGKAMRAAADDEAL